jgi:SAM-dependent methyltransferase
MHQQHDDEPCHVDLWTREETPLISVKISPSEYIQISQYGSNDHRWGIFSCVWDGSLGLIEYLRRNIKTPKTSLVIDLGSGTGIVGIAIARLGYANVILTDLPEALDLMHRNVAINPDILVSVERLIWGDALPDTIKSYILSSREILITGADIIYRASLFGPLLDTLDSIWKLKTENSSIRCILANHSIRSYLTDFYNLAQSRGFVKTHVSNVILPEKSSDELPEISASVDLNSANVVHIVELTKILT